MRGVRGKRCGVTWATFLGEGALWKVLLKTVPRSWQYGAATVKTSMKSSQIPRSHFPFARMLKAVPLIPAWALTSALVLMVAASAMVRAEGGAPSTGAKTGASLDLLQNYPTTLTAGDTSPDRARQWEFTSNDLYRLTRFRLEVGKALRIDVGPADLGIGHCDDGALWAVVIPRQSGVLISSTTNIPEAIAHVWLRFHPARIAQLFPPDTVFGDGTADVVAQVRRTANQKMTSSWQAGGRGLIPAPKDMTVDVDTQGGVRRFFAVDVQASTAQYIAAFERRAVILPAAMSLDTARAAFDQLWEALDRKYAMFVLRPEVDWATLREEYRSRALACKSVTEFAGTCAEMLKPLRDLHVWIQVAGKSVPVFNRPRTANANPSAHRAILGSLHDEGHGVQWAMTDDRIGFIAIYGWGDQAIPALCLAALEKMRDTRGLIVDVRLNGGGNEDRAMEFAARFLKQEFVYAYSQFRNGPGHTNLTQKFPRKIAARGPWRYDRPVILLIGQKCMSSNESFICMMTGDPDVTTMGDHSCGSSGNPEIINLPLDMTVSVPRWIDYLPDGTPLDERGFRPQVQFKPGPGAFEGARDDLLDAALKRLRQTPQPAKSAVEAKGK